MQIIVSPVSNGDNFLLDVEQEAPIKFVREQIAARVGTQPGNVKLVCEGLELLDAGTLHDFYVQPLSTVRLVILTSAPPPLPPALPPHLASASASASARSPHDDDDSTLVTDEEMPRAIVVTGLPDADAAATELAITEAFSPYGAIGRIIFQNESPPSASSSSADCAAAASEAPRQHAVIIFARETSAAASLCVDGRVVMGAVVSVVLASSLAPPPPAPHDDGALGPPRRPTLASYVVADMLAQGVLYGVQGVAHLRRMDAEVGLTQRIAVLADSTRERLGDVDRRYRVTASVAAGFEAAKAQAQDLDRTYNITATAAHAARVALDSATGLAQRALASNPRLASGLASGLASAKAAVGNLVDQARADAALIGTRVQTRVSTAGGTVLHVPGSVAAGTAAAAAVGPGGAAAEAAAASSSSEGRHI